MDPGSLYVVCTVWCLLSDKPADPAFGVAGEEGHPVRAARAALQLLSREREPALGIGHRLVDGLRGASVELTPTIQTLQPGTGAPAGSTTMLARGGSAGRTPGGFGPGIFGLGLAGGVAGVLAGPPWAKS